MHDYGVALDELIFLVKLEGLLDFPLQGSEVTYFGNKVGGACSKLDRVLVKNGETGWSDGVVL